MTADQFGAPLRFERDPRLQRLDKFVGTWRLHHRALDTGEEWGGQDTYDWLAGGFYLASHHEEFGRDITGIMLIGYERAWGSATPSPDLIGHWFEGSTGNHFRYVWEVGDDAYTFWFGEQGGEASFHGTFSADRRTITGAWWWPGGGYELTMTRIAPTGDAEPANPTTEELEDRG